MYLVWSAALTLVLAAIAASGATLEADCDRLARERAGGLQGLLDLSSRRRIRDRPQPARF